MAKKLNQDATAVENILALYTFLLSSHQQHSLNQLSQRFAVSKPSMLRYLQQLEKSEFGKILCEKRGREHFYSLDRPSSIPQISLSPQGLQQLALCRDFMSRVLPAHMQRTMDVALQQATAYLPEGAMDTLGAQEEGLGQSMSKGRIDYTPFEPMLKALIQAIAEKSVCTVTYKKRRHEEAKTFDYAPQRFISFNEAIYIRGWKITDKGAVECVLVHGTDLALHRFQDVILTKRSSCDLPCVPENAPGAFGYMDHDSFSVTLKFTPKMSNYIVERIWSDDQIIEEQEDGGIILTMTARNEYEITPWVLGMGAGVEVLEPQWLRDDVAEEAERVFGIYGNSLNIKRRQL